MKRSGTLLNLIAIAKIARRRVEILSRIEDGPTNLSGYCGAAARYLELLSNDKGIFPTFVSGTFNYYNRMLGTYNLLSGHAWLEHEGYILDITATQFREAYTKINRNFNKKVYICKDNNPHYKKEKIGHEAKLDVRNWYDETLDEICEKIERLPNES
jgi:hypothetical protein